MQQEKQERAEVREVCERSKEKQESKIQSVKWAKKSEEKKADLVSVQTLPGVSKYFVCMGSGRWINCSAPEEEETSATCQAEEQANKETEINVIKSTPQISPGVPG